MVNYADPRLYRLSMRSITTWGDYGHILQHGLTTHIGRKQGMLQLWRTGPFAPPITGSFDIVVSDPTKIAIESADIPTFRSIAFRPVLKARIVQLNWPEWDLASGRPRHYPFGGEPENYLREAEHDPALAAAMPEFWELLLSTGSREHRQQDLSRETGDIPLYKRSWNGNDWFIGDTTRYLYATETARNWIEPRYGEWIDFEDVQYSDREYPVPFEPEELG